MQSHTILKTIAKKYANRPVLVLGGRTDEVRKVAEGCNMYLSGTVRRH